MDAAGGPQGKAKPKPSVAKRPAMTIAKFPARSPTAKAPPAASSGRMWHGGFKVQTRWLKKVQKTFTLCEGTQRGGLMSKARGNTQQLRAGVPPPPMPSVINSLSLTGQWNARFSQQHVRSQEWRSEKNVIFVAGRPVGVIICSHLGAGPVEWDGYHNTTFSPLRPVILCGPSGRTVQAPDMDCKFTVIEWWKDFVF